MKKRNAIFGLLISASFIFAAGTLSSKTSAKAGYLITQEMGGGAQAFATGAGGAAGYMGAAWAGAKLGGKVGAVVGGPWGLVIGAGLGAL